MEELSYTKTNERNYGVDLLRILSMLMVVILHVLIHGGVIDGCVKFSAKYYSASFLEISAYCAVNVFAMISGYVLVCKNVQYKKIISLWGTVLFYSAGILLLFKFIPFFGLAQNISKKDLLNSFFPVITERYWYFTKYVGMFFFIPFINKLLNSLEKKEYELLCLIIMILFSIFPLIRLNDYDPFLIYSGFSTVWLTCMYIIGGFIKKYPPAISKKKCILLFFVSVFCTWFSKLMSHIIAKAVFGKNDYELDLFTKYTSIFIIFSGIAIFMLFSQLKIENFKVKKIILLLSKLSFSVYLIHEHWLVRASFIKDRFNFLAEENILVLPIKVICYAILIFSFCILIDFFRYFIFTAIKSFYRRNIRDN